MTRFVCVHGHFYQPPRENAWLEFVERQDSADPYHDWNERITAECYAPNAFCRILDGSQRIVRIVNNYERLSFNFGPTLLSWLERHSPNTYQAILAADRVGRGRFGGHGPALAQVYNHIIMPLANLRDKRTQVRWGIADFTARFGRAPEGMWLAETAVDTETLEVLASEGIAFTILSPYQASRVRPLGSTANKDWLDVRGGKIDPTRPYLCRLPSGRTIALFFYDGPVSQGVAFERLLDNGEKFAGRLLGLLKDSRSQARLAHIATDGETYGHHHPHGDMALAYALDTIAATPGVRLTIYGEFLELHPPTEEVQILEKTAWSCSHGVGRWVRDCGCSSGRPGWNQQWRTPLREALDWLRDSIAPKFETVGKRWWKSPWDVRDDYIRVMLDRSPANVSDFLRRHAKHRNVRTDEVLALKLLECQRNLLYMYTSCGWFFDDISGIETVQIIQYAARAMQLAKEAMRLDLCEDFLNRLGQARSNIPEHSDGRVIFEKWVKPASVDLPKVAAHIAVSSLFEDYEEHTTIGSYSADLLEVRREQVGNARLVTGRLHVASQATLESDEMAFGALHFGDHNLIGGVRSEFDEDEFQVVQKDLDNAFHRADFPAVIVGLNRAFGAASSLQSLFCDEQRKILNLLLEPVTASMEASYRQLYEQNAVAMRFVRGLNAPLPAAFRQAAHFLINADLRRAVEADEPDLGRVRQLLADRQTWGVSLDAAALGYVTRKTVARLMERINGGPDDLPRLGSLTELVELARAFGFEVDLWQTQNHYWELLKSTYPVQAERAEDGDLDAMLWTMAYKRLGERLNVNVIAALQPLALPEPVTPQVAPRVEAECLVAPST